MLFDAVTIRDGKVTSYLEIEVTHKQALRAVAPVRWGDTTAVVASGAALIGDAIQNPDDEDDW